MSEIKLVKNKFNERDEKKLGFCYRPVEQHLDSKYKERLTEAEPKIKEENQRTKPPIDNKISFIYKQ